MANGRGKDLDGVQDFDPQEIKMCSAKHTPLDEFEAIDGVSVVNGQ